MMQGWELKQDRDRLRRQERETARRALLGAGTALALDEEDLIRGAALDNVSSWGNAVKRRLVLVGLLNLQVSKETIAKVWSVSLEQIADWMRPNIIDRSGYAAEIDAAVEKAIPATQSPAQPGTVPR